VGHDGQAESGGEYWFGKGDLGAVGSPGAPSAVGLSFDAESVVDLGVVAFAEQAEVVQVGRAVLRGPFEDVVGFGLARVLRTPSQWLHGHGRGVVVGRVFSH